MVVINGCIYNRNENRNKPRTSTEFEFFLLISGNNTAVLQINIKICLTDRYRL